MRPFRAKEIRGNWATLLLPILPDDAIDYALLAAETEHFIAAQVNGIYSNGTAGEFHTQTEDEFDRVNALLAERCERAGMPFQIGANHSSAQIARERVRRAKALAPSAFQVTLPDWFPPSLPEVLAFLEKMAEEAAPISLIVYNPPHAKRRLTPPEWLVIAQRVPGVVGMKVPGGDEAWYAAMQPLFARLSVFIPGHLLADGLSRGAHGAYSNVACLSPAGAQRWYELCKRDPVAGQALGQRIATWWAANVAPLIVRDGLSNAAADKAAAVAGGWLPEFTARLRWTYQCSGDVAARQIGADEVELVGGLRGVDDRAETTLDAQDDQGEGGHGGADEKERLGEVRPDDAGDAAEDGVDGAEDADEENADVEVEVGDAASASAGM